MEYINTPRTPEMKIIPIGCNFDRCNKNRTISPIIKPLISTIEERKRDTQAAAISPITPGLIPEKIPETIKDL